MYPNKYSNFWRRLFAIIIDGVVLESISMLFNEKRRAVHDYIAGSVVVRKANNGV